MAIILVGNKEYHGIKGLDKKEDLLQNMSGTDVGAIYVEIDSNSGIGDIFELNKDFRGIITWYKL